MSRSPQLHDDLRSRLEHVWYGGGRVPWWLAMLVPLYRGLRSLDLALRRLCRPRRLPVPVAVIGNLGVGGSGKTPLVIALVEALRSRGWKPGVVSRGYGGTQRAPLLLDDMFEPARVGDEPCLIRHRAQVPVAVGRDRARAAALLVENGCDLVLADDGLQNPSLARDVEICVVDGRRRFGNGQLLPAGPLREPATRFAGFDFRVCNGGIAQPGEVPMQLVGEMAVAMAGEACARPLAAFAGQRVHAVAAIGNPERFFTSLRAHGIEVVAHPFPDHHRFVPADLDFTDANPVLMTEKDAVKCRAFAVPRHWCVPVRAMVPETFLDALDARLRTRLKDS